MTLFRTSDGKVFEDQNMAIAHAQVLDFNANGGYDEFGKPYEYSKIDRSIDGENWV